MIGDLIQLHPQSEQPLYLQLANGIMHNIRSGKLRKGLQLPGSREAAKMFSVNRMTIVAAYDELTAQGWIESLPRKGTFVKASIPELSPKKIREHEEAKGISETIGFPLDTKKILVPEEHDRGSEKDLYINDGFPDIRLAPLSDIHRNMRRLAKLPSHKKYLNYSSGQGSPLLRKALSKELNDSRGLPITPDHLLVTSGAQMGLFIIASLMLNKGDEIIVANPGYAGANHTFRQFGAVINYVGVDEDGMKTSEVEKWCTKKKIKMVYVIPHHHNPTTVTMCPERRLQLINLASKYRFAILEDDYDYDFQYASKPILPIASMDMQGHVIYIGTLTKTLAPGIRIGFIVAPKPLIDLATAYRQIIDHQGDAILENAIAAMIEDGTIGRHIKKSLIIYRQRRDHFCQLLRQYFGNQIEFTIPEGGMAVWVHFKKIDISTLSRLAKEKGVIISDGSRYFSKNKSNHYLRMGFASLTFEEQEKGLRVLREVLASKLLGK